MLKGIWFLECIKLCSDNHLSQTIFIPTDHLK